MNRYILQRIINAFIVVFGSMTIVFFILHFLPGDIARIVAGDTAPTEVVDELRTNLGLDLPLIEQYFNYIKSLMQGDLSVSYVSSEPVLQKLMKPLQATLALTIMSSLVALVLGITLGMLAAIYKNSWLDQLIRIIGLFGVSTPNFWIGIILITIFSVKFNLLPAIGNGSFEQLILPSIGLGFTGAGALSRMVRNNMLEVIDEPFVRTLRAKGLNKIIMYRHVLRNALIPVITMLGLIFGEMLAGSIVTETVFSREGLGRVVLDAVNTMDVPVIQGVVLLSSTFYVLVNLIIDYSYTKIDPRQKGQYKRRYD